MGLIDKKDTHIDRNALDDEWVAQPALYQKYSMMAADARLDYDEAKAALDLVAAELDQSIRSDPESYGLSKLTEGKIKSAIPLQEQHRDAVKEVIQAKHHLDVCNSVVSALDHKKTALQKLVDLFLADYFSKPKASVDNREKMEEVEKTATRRRGRRAKE